MPFILALLFSLSSNLDNFVIGFSYGVQNKRIALVPNMIIAPITAVVTYLFNGIRAMDNPFDLASRIIR